MSTENKKDLTLIGGRNFIIGLVGVIFLGQIPGIGPFVAIIGGIMAVLGFIQLLFGLFK